MRRLQQALEARGREPWVDWSDIHPSADWFEEIETAISETGVFVYVLSPDSLDSPVCRQELETAVRYGKRLVPVVCRDVDSESVPHSLARLQWIFMRDNGGFDSGVAAIINALDTDLEWLHFHTELLDRARAWESGGSHPSALLRGAVLKEAESRMAAFSGKEPALSGLHQSYLQASRRGETRRLQWLLGAACVALVTVLFLAFWANNERNRAEEQREMTAASALGSKSRLVQLERAALIEQSAILGVEAMQRLPTLEHDSVLRQALLVLPSPVFGSKANIAPRLEIFERRPALVISNPELLAHAQGTEVLITDLVDKKTVLRLPHDETVQDILLTSDRSRLFTLTEKGNVYIWSFTDGQLIGRPLDDLPIPASAMAVFPAEPVVAVGLTLGKARAAIITIGPDGKPDPQMIPTRLKGAITRIRFSNDGLLLAASAGTSHKTVNNVEVLRVSDGESFTLIRQKHPAVDLEFDKDTKRLAVASDSAVYLYQLPDGQLIHRLRNGTSVHSVEFSNEKNELLTGGGNGDATLWDARHFGRIRSYQHEGPVQFVRFSDDESYILSASNDGTARLWDRRNGAELARAAHRTLVRFAAFAEDAEYAVSISDDGVLRAWVRPQTTKRLPRSKHQDAAPILSIDGRYAALQVDDSTWKVMTSDGTRELMRFSKQAEVTSVDLDRNVRMVAIGFTDNTVQLYELASGDSKHLLPHDKAADAVAFSPDAEFLVTASRDYRTQMWRVSSGERVWSHQHDYYAVASGFSEDGQRVATATFNLNKFAKAVKPSTAAATVWGTSTGLPIAELGHPDDVTELALSPDGSMVLTGSGDRKARIWHVDSGRQLHVLDHQFPVRAVAFSPDGRYVATGATDNFTRLWDVATGRERVRIRHHGSANRIRFSDDGAELQVVTDRFVHRHTLDGGALIKQVCGRLTHNLTVEEWRLYVPDETPVQTCPNLPPPANRGSVAE